MRRGAWIASLVLPVIAVLLAGCLLRARPTDAEIHRQAIDFHSLGIEAETQGQWREAIGHFERSIAMAPTPAAHCHLGRCQLELGDLTSAENHLRRALELSPTYELAETHLAQIEAIRGEAPAAPPAAEPIEVAQVPEPLPRVEIALPTPPTPTEPPPADLPSESPEPPSLNLPPLPEPVVPEVVESPEASAPPPVEETAEEPPEVVETAEEPADPPQARRASEREIVHDEARAPRDLPTSNEVRALLFPTLHGEAEGPSGAQRLRQTRLDSPEFHFAQAVGFEGEQDYLSALREYRLAFDLDPSRVDGLLAIARIHSRLGHDDEALRAYERALELSPTDAAVPFQLGNHFFRQDQLERAVIFYEQTLRLDPAHRSAHNNLGAALRDLNRLEEAAEHLEAAIALDPTYAPPHRNLGNIRADQGRDREALEAYRQYVRLGGSAAAEVEGWIRELEQQLGEP